MTRREVFLKLFGISTVSSINVESKIDNNVDLWNGPIYVRKHIRCGETIVFPSGETTIATSEYYPRMQLMYEDYAASYKIPGFKD